MRKQILTTIGTLLILFLTTLTAQAQLFQSPSNSGFGGQSLTGKIRQNDELLPPDRAFVPTLTRFDDGRINLHFEIHPDYYLYRDRIKIRVLNEVLTLDEVALPEGVWHEDEFFGRQMIYDFPIVIPINPKGDLTQVKNLHLFIEAQGCAKKGLCFPPHRWEETLSINPNLKIDDALISLEETLALDIPMAEHDRLTQYLLDKKYMAIPLFFIFGLLLTFTPCVLPMLPILSGILTSRGVETAKNGFVVSLIYVLSMASIYVLLGLLAAFFGKGFAAYLQHPYVLIGFAAIFVLLALSMFGLYELQMPAKVQNYLNRISQNQEGKSGYAGVIIMGMLSALIVGPCVTAPLIGVIGLVAQSQDYLLGGTILFSMSMGMGVPLLILGASSGHLLPKAGGWMTQVKILFGFILLGIAAYFIGRIIPFKWEQWLYALVALSAATWLFIYVKKSKAYLSFFSLVAIASLIFGLYSIKESTRVIETIDFTEIKGIEGLNSALAENTLPLTMLEFNADWCVACKEMEKYVFSHDSVKTLLKPIQLLSSDVTANDALDQQLQKHFSIYGPPAILFFDHQGNELEPYRIMGSVSKESFTAHITLLYENMGVPVPLELLDEDPELTPQETP